MASGFIPDWLNGGALHMTTIVAGAGVSILYLVYQLQQRNMQKKFQFDLQGKGLFAVKVFFHHRHYQPFYLHSRDVRRHTSHFDHIVHLNRRVYIRYEKTVIGRRIYAIGGNEKAAELSGIKTKRLTFMVFVNMGVLAALSGLIFAARLNAATPKAGNLFELDAIAACFIGGASAYGGIGTIGGAIIGGLVMGVMNNGMSLLGLGIDWQQAIKGLVLLIAVAFDIYNKNKTS